MPYRRRLFSTPVRARPCEPGATVRRSREALRAAAAAHSSAAGGKQLRLPVGDQLVEVEDRLLGLQPRELVDLGELRARFPLLRGRRLGAGRSGSSGGLDRGGTERCEGVTGGGPGVGGGRSSSEAVPAGAARPAGGARRWGNRRSRRAPAGETFSRTRASRRGRTGQGGRRGRARAAARAARPRELGQVGGHVCAPPARGDDRLRWGIGGHGGRGLGRRRDRGLRRARRRPRRRGAPLRVQGRPRPDGWHHRLGARSAPAPRARAGWARQAAAPPGPAAARRTRPGAPRLDTDAGVCEGDGSGGGGATECSACSGARLRGRAGPRARCRRRDRARAGRRSPRSPRGALEEAERCLRRDLPVGAR